MNKKLSRRDFLKLAGVTSAGLVLSACGVDATQLPTPIATLAPTLTPMSSPTQEPVATPAFYEKAKDILNKLLQEGFANGSLSKKFNIEASQLQTKRNRARNTDVIFAQDTQTGEIMLAGYMENEKITWKVVGLGDLLGVLGISLGTMVGEGFDQEDNTQPVNVAVGQDFNFMTPAGGFTVQYFNDWGPPRSVKNAKALGVGLRVAALYSSGNEDDYDTYESGNPTLSDVRTVDDAEKYMDARFEQIIGVIKDARQKGVASLDIIFCNEPWWKDANNMPRDLDDGLTSVFGGAKNTIVTYYIRFLDKLSQEGLVPGTDFNIIGLNVPGLEEDTPYARALIDKIVSIKQAIAAQLHTNVDKVNFDLGMEFHLGQTQGQRNITMEVPIKEETLVDWLKYVQGKIGGRIHFTEVDYLEKTDETAPSDYVALVAAAYKSKVVDTFNFWSTFNGKGDWVNPLFQNTTYRGDVYMKLKEKVTNLISSLPNNS